MQITDYSLEVSGLKQERTTATYVPSAAIEMTLTFQSPFKLYYKILYPVKTASIKGMKFDEADNGSCDETSETLNGTHSCVCFHRLA